MSTEKGLAEKKTSFIARTKDRQPARGLLQLRRKTRRSSKKDVRGADDKTELQTRRIGASVGRGNSAKEEGRLMGRRRVTGEGTSATLCGLGKTSLNHIGQGKEESDELCQTRSSGGAGGKIRTLS